jgi:hypothetical protein
VNVATLVTGVASFLLHTLIYYRKRHSPARGSATHPLLLGVLYLPGRASMVIRRILRCPAIDLEGTAPFDLAWYCCRWHTTVGFIGYRIVTYPEPVERVFGTA